AVGLDQRREDGLRFRDPGGVLGGQADGGTGGQEHPRQDADRPSAHPPVRLHRPSIHRTISRCNLSTSASATVSTAVSVTRVGRLAVLVSSNGPSSALTLASPASP